MSNAARNHHVVAMEVAATVDGRPHVPAQLYVASVLDRQISSAAFPGMEVEEAEEAEDPLPLNMI